MKRHTTLTRITSGVEMTHTLTSVLTYKTAKTKTTGKHAAKRDGKRLTG